MKTLRFTSLITLGLATLWGGSAASAANVSGTYADKGTMMAEASSIVSLHALLGLEFTPEVGVADYADTAEVELVDRDGWLEIKTFTESGTEISRSRWGPQNGFAHQEGKAVFRIPKNKDEMYSFLLSSAADGAALEVRIYKVMPSALGPRADPIGSYFFVKTE